MLAAAILFVVNRLAYREDSQQWYYYHLRRSTFRKPEVLYQVLPRAPGSYFVKSDNSSLDLCHSFSSLRNDPRVVALAEEWRESFGVLFEKILEDGPTVSFSMDERSFETYFGDHLRALWQRHGTPVFSFWIKHFNLQILLDNEKQKSRRNILSVEEHALGFWIGKQVLDKRINSRIEKYPQYKQSNEGGRFLADASMVCAFSELLTEKLYHENQFYVTQYDKTSYDDIMHAFVWSHLSLIEQRPHFGKVLAYLSRLCKVISLNYSYMACWHGVGHGVNIYSRAEDIPATVPTLSELEDSSLSTLSAGTTVYESKSWQEDRDKEIVALAMLGCEHITSSMSTSSEDEVSKDYAASSCYTGFYHQLFLTSRRVMMVDKVSWKDKMMTFCTSIADLYLEALWKHYKMGEASKLEGTLRSAVAACFYSRAFFTSEHGESASQSNYLHVSKAAASCSKLGKGKCQALCEENKKSRDHKYTRAAKQCTKACIQLANDNVQPLCWHGVGTMLKGLASHCLDVVHNGQPLEARSTGIVCPYTEYYSSTESNLLVCSLQENTHKNVQRVPTLVHKSGSMHKECLGALRSRPFCRSKYAVHI